MFTLRDLFSKVSRRQKIKVIEEKVGSEVEDIGYFQKNKHFNKVGSTN